MAAWKQIVFTLVILVAAAAAWARFFPGAPEVLARWGIDWAYASAPPRQARSIPSRQAAATLAAARQTSSPQPAGTATINDRLQAIGTGRANASVTVNPYSSGRLVEFLVESGTRVDKGQIIATLDSETEMISQDRAKLALQDAAGQARAGEIAARFQRRDTGRRRRCRSGAGRRQAGAAGCRTRLAAPLDRRADRRHRRHPADLGRQLRHQPVGDRHARRPLLDPGRFPGARALRRRRQGRRAIVGDADRQPEQRLHGAVSAIDNHIDEKSRTLLVKAKIANPADSLRAGMSFQITMKFPGETYPAVSPLAILWGSDGAYVWQIEDGKAKRVAVRIIQRNTETVLIDAPIDRRRHGGDRGHPERQRGRRGPYRRRRTGRRRRRRLMTGTVNAAGDTGFTALFIRRPVMAFVLNTLIAVAGLAAFYGVEIRELPDVDRPVITVSTAFEGAAAETVDRELTDTHRGRGRPRLRRQVDLVDLVLRPEPRHHRVQRRRRPQRRRLRCARRRRPRRQPDAGHGGSRRASSRPTPIPSR